MLKRALKYVKMRMIGSGRKRKKKMQRKRMTLLTQQTTTLMSQTANPMRTMKQAKDSLML